MFRFRTYFGMFTISSSTRYGLLTVDWWFFYFVVSWILMFTHFNSYYWNEWLNYDLVVAPSLNPSNSPEHTAIPGLVVTSILQCLTVAVCSSQIELYLLPRKLTWQARKFPMFNRKYIFKWLIFQPVMLVFRGVTPWNFFHIDTPLNHPRSQMAGITLW